MDDRWRPFLPWAEHLQIILTWMIIETPDSDHLCSLEKETKLTTNEIERESINKQKKKRRKQAKNMSQEKALRVDRSNSGIHLH